MKDEALLEVTPEFMIRAIIHRRERLAMMIPKQLESRGEELQVAEPLAKDAKERREALQDKIAAFDDQLLEVKSGSEEHQSLIDSRESFIAESQQAENAYLENELFRRRADSRTKRLTFALNDCQRAIEYWENILEKGWDNLLTDAQRVESGGPSSYAVKRKEKEAKS